ncbi:MAG: hypothetical protein V7K25_30860 [Nostoc sp.]|uniref:hypothetical protein n=1 Tax=Nostoc sp. TaxID=1180 RepID=UPI002FF5950A
MAIFPLRISLVSYDTCLMGVRWGDACGGKLRLSTTFPLRTRSPMLGFKSDRPSKLFLA